MKCTQVTRWPFDTGRHVRAVSPTQRGRPCIGACVPLRKRLIWDKLLEERSEGRGCFKGKPSPVSPKDPRITHAAHGKTQPRGRARQAPHGHCVPRLPPRPGSPVRAAGAPCRAGHRERNHRTGPEGARGSGQAPHPSNDPHPRTPPGTEKGQRPLAALRGRLYSSPAAAEPLRRHRVTVPGRVPSQAAAGRLGGGAGSLLEITAGATARVTETSVERTAGLHPPHTAPLRSTGAAEPAEKEQRGWTALPGRPRGWGRAGTVPAAPPGGGCTYPPAKRCTRVSLWLILVASTRVAERAPGRFRPAHGSA